MFSISEALDLVTMTIERVRYNGRIKLAIVVVVTDFCLTKYKAVHCILDAAEQDHPDELCTHRDGIVDRLYALAGGCSNCARRPTPIAALVGVRRDERLGGSDFPSGGGGG
jgi:hypothetical protein